MSQSARNNKYLKVNPSVVLTPIIEPVIIELNNHFELEGVTSVVTSGLRTAEDQLRIIRDYLKQKQLNVKYPEAMSGAAEEKFVWENQEVYKWQPGWSALLNAGIIINPPVRAICLMNYINAQGINRKGQYINPSPHFNGTAFDIGGGQNGLNDELAVVLKAKGKIKGLVGYVIERNNNCLHIDCK